MKAIKVNAVDLSRFVAKYFHELEEEITNLKLQKLLYYIQSWHLVHFDHPLFDDVPEAWVNGPVYTSVYAKYKGFGGGPIALYGASRSSALPSKQEMLEEMNLNENQVGLIDNALHFYGKMSTMTLVYRTHTEFPWIDGNSGESEHPIPV